jgi:peroxiredoxin
MATSRLRYGIPDIDLPRVDGGEINPSELIGHDFVVFFCPADRAAAVREIEDYRSRSEDFEKCGAWLIGVLTDRHEELPAGPADEPHLPVARDPDGAAWAAFESLLDPESCSAKEAGGTFLFARGGCLARAWPGSGHAADALCELRRRA